MATESFKQKVVIENPNKCVEIKKALTKEDANFKDVKPAKINENNVVGLWFNK